ncbi:hypothetical protein [Actinomadura sp. B10D3]|uniref:hypothetical protein n=1 Tax=Actinomadura sp. B10D3 TaxID=3153557 RepID=UPI00325D3F65
MTTDPHDEHGEILRRALHAEAESVNPAGDGLERIRARIADGQRRRFGFGRFGPARFGFDRFTINWARPVLAVAAAVVIAALGVTAPQTIDLIQQSVGNSGPSHDGGNGTDGDRTDAGGNPVQPAPPSGGASTPGGPSSSQPPSSDSPPGTSSCQIPPQDGVTTAASPGATPAPSPSATPCPSDTPTPPTSTTPTPPTSTTPDPGTTTDEPSTPPATPPTKTSDQGDGASTP